MGKILKICIVFFIFLTNYNYVYAGYGTGVGSSSTGWTDDGITIRTTAIDKLAIGTASSGIAVNVVGTLTASTGFTTPNFFIVGGIQINANGIVGSSSSSNPVSFLNSSLADSGNIFMYIGKGGSLNNSWINYLKSVDGQNINNKIIFKTNASAGLTIRGNDNYVGINQSSPTSMFEVRETTTGTGSVAMRVNYDNTGLAGSAMVQFTKALEGVVGSVDIINDTTLAYNTFTGSHYTKVKNRGLKKFMILESTGENLADQKQCVVTKLSNKKMSKRIIGVYGGKTQNGKEMILSIGAGFIWIKNNGENIKKGDYLCSSNIPGYAEKQNDNIVHNYTIAKTTQETIWKKTEKKKLVTCTYHGG